MIEILKTSEGEEVCLEKLTLSFLRNNKCILYVNNNDIQLALSLKKKHFLMETYVKEYFYAESTPIFSYPNVSVINNYSEIPKEGKNAANFFIGIVDCDINNLDRFTKKLLRTQQNIYFNTDPIQTQYMYIVKPTQTFLVCKSSKSRKNLVENGILNFFPINYFTGKSDYTMAMEHGFAILMHSFGKDKFDLNEQFIDRFKDFLLENGIKFEYKDYDFFINDKKFFGNSTTYTVRQDFVMVTSLMILITEFEPEKQFFTDVLKYSGKHKYTGLLEEYDNLSYNDIVKSVMKIMIDLSK